MGKQWKHTHTINSVRNILKIPVQDSTACRECAAAAADKQRASANVASARTQRAPGRVSGRCTHPQRRPPASSTSGRRRRPRGRRGSWRAIAQAQRRCLSHGRQKNHRAREASSPQRQQNPAQKAVPHSRRRDCHFTDIPSPSILKHPLKGEGVAAE